MKRLLTIPIFFLMVCLLVLGACGKKTVDTPPTFFDTASDKMLRMETEESLASDADSAAEPVQSSSSSNGARRMVHYEGNISLRANKPDDILDTISQKVTEAGGYVENRTDEWATFRIPVALFQDLFDQVLTFGDVLSKSISARDISDAYTDMALRLNIARESRNRYLELLKQSDREEDKLALLKEIARLTETIETMEQQLKLLESLAAFSRLHVSVNPPEFSGTRHIQGDIEDFQWTHRLSPFSRVLSEHGKKLSFETPGQMVRISKTPWITESADGVVFWAHKRKNRPEGTTDFWVDAVSFRRKSDFNDLNVKDVGSYTVLSFESRGLKPYVYEIGLKADDDDLYVFEVYYPTKELRDQYASAVYKSIQMTDKP